MTKAIVEGNAAMNKRNRLVTWIMVLSASAVCCPMQAVEPVAWPSAEMLPQVPEGFSISIFAAEPLLYKPTAVCFDAQGRLLVGQGPQYHLSKSIEKSDSVILLLDTDHDGIADKRKVFATGLNSIQGMAWKGRDLYIANAPELTVVRDLDGDDVADQYVVVYTDLGNHEHALHGLVWGPDGRLYMSKGNSKGHNQPEKYGRVAPRAFRELWDVAHPAGVPDIPPPQTFTAETYRKTYHNPIDDWGRQGGVLRCGPMGSQLEIVARGMRNPWDIAMDSEFNWLGTDNDQTQGDRIIMPFYGAHFGWGHRYSSHWTGAGNLPTVPVSGPLTSGSWVGITYYQHAQFLPRYRDVFFINDWLFGTYVYRPGWNGALRDAADGTLEPFIQRRPDGMLYRPTDLAVGPGGDLYILGWGGNYHYEKGQEGSWVFRVSCPAGVRPVVAQRTPLGRRSVAQLITDLGPQSVPARRVNAQDELVRRGTAICDQLVEAISTGELSRGQQTWAVWALGRMGRQDPKHAEWLRKWALPVAGRGALRIARNLRIQAIRILASPAQRFGNPESLLAVVDAALSDPDPRIRFAGMQAVHEMRLAGAVHRVIEQLASEEDRVVFYAGWQALRATATVAARRVLLDHEYPRVRLAALLGLQEDYKLTREDVMALVDRERSPEVQSWALTFALNPLPVAKLSNDRLRIEMEQIAPVGEMIDRAQAARTNPKLWQIYLRMLARASVREGAQQQELLMFYRTLEAVEERALILPAAATTLEAFPDLWTALGSAAPLQQAAVAGISSLVKFRVKSLRSAEANVRSAERSLSSVGTFSTLLTDRLFKKLQEVDPQDSSVAPALRAIVALPLPANWSLDQQSLNTLLRILEMRTEPVVRRRALRLIAKIDANRVAGREPLVRSIRRLCRVPDAQLYRELLAVKAHLQLEIEVPIPPEVTVAEVLARLGEADATRGQQVFFDRISGAGCVTCHRVQGRGSPWAPDLSGVGVRLTPENLVKAIIDPNAAITEGYAVQLVVTADGRTYRGAVIQETGSALTLLQGEGTQVTVETRTIERRQQLKQSVMPTGYGRFDVQQLADLTAWLSSLRTVAAPVAADAD
ncbi:MAG: hypothetical protein CMJ70_16840 [Planctomycetaceae bacterium]|nr:hypothetical protein [Planctomycetaceae bacterium]HAA68173.1 hypothetical protein [Planctomycetaceae bacterium]|tara:strand:+ start:778 stop:4065 length:3288 start_codon:yes stop_codon:yes gene_type:complete